MLHLLQKCFCTSHLRRHRIFQRVAGERHGVGPSFTSFLNAAQIPTASPIHLQTDHHWLPFNIMSTFKVNHGSRKARKQVGDYILEKAIGFGAFSTVYEGSNVHSKLKVAVKSINLHRINVSEKHLSNLKQEIDILRKCRHSNIVQLLHTYQTSNHIYLIMQFCGGGDLHRFVQRNGKMTERNAQRFTIQFVEGLKYLHSLKIIHRDLKPQNILLSENSKNAIVRIADFGFARYKPTGHNMVDTMCGSPLYMAPEILKCNKYDSKGMLCVMRSFFCSFLVAFSHFRGFSKMFWDFK